MINNFIKFTAIPCNTIISISAFIIWWLSIYFFLFNFNIMLFINNIIFHISKRFLDIRFFRLVIFTSSRRVSYKMPWDFFAFFNRKWYCIYYNIFIFFIRLFNLDILSTYLIFNYFGT
jgi:hypothetical protein